MMKYSHNEQVLFAVALPTLVVLVLFFSGSSHGQSQREKSGGGAPVESRVKPTSMVRDRKTDPAANPASLAFAAAAEQNATLRNELSWTFGGKEQRGWYLYTELIDRLLDIDTDAGSPEFALALSRWQQRSQLAATGILDQDSLYAMISEWQGRRIKERTVAQPEQLITAPASEFYAPERVAELRMVDREAYAAYKLMLAAAVADPSLDLNSATNEKFLKIISSFRTPEYQEQLRKHSPNAGRAGLAVNSPHFTGKALDLYVGGDPVSTDDANRALQVQTPVYRWLVRNADRFGFQPYYYEPWHWEYVR